jgi:hypothetical protein
MSDALSCPDLLANWLLMQQLAKDTVVSGIHATHGLTLLWLVQQHGRASAEAAARLSKSTVKGQMATTYQHLLLFLDMQVLQVARDSKAGSDEHADRGSPELGVSLRYAWYEEEVTNHVRDNNQHAETELSKTIRCDEPMSHNQPHMDECKETYHENCVTAYSSAAGALLSHVGDTNDQSSVGPIPYTSVVRCMETGHRPEDARVEALIRELTRRNRRSRDYQAVDATHDPHAASSLQHVSTDGSLGGVINVVFLAQQPGAGKGGESLESWWPVQLSVPRLLTRLWHADSAAAGSDKDVNMLLVDTSHLHSSGPPSMKSNSGLAALCREDTHHWNHSALAQAAVTLDYLCERLENVAGAGQKQECAMEVCYAQSPPEGMASPESVFTELQRYATARHSGHGGQPSRAHVDALVRVEPLTAAHVHEWLRVDPLVMAIMATKQAACATSEAQQLAANQVLSGGPVRTGAFVADLVLSVDMQATAVILSVRRNWNRACPPNCDPHLRAALFECGFEAPDLLIGCVAQIQCDSPGCRLLHLVGDPISEDSDLEDGAFMWQLLLESAKHMAHDMHKTHVVWHQPLARYKQPLAGLRARHFCDHRQTGAVLSNLGSTLCFGRRYPTAWLAK